MARPTPLETPSASLRLQTTRGLVLLALVTIALSHSACSAIVNVDYGQVDCLQDSDCNSTAAICNTMASTCEYFSCGELMKARPNAPAGEYMMRLSSDPTKAAFKAYCTKSGWTYTNYGIDVGNNRDDLSPDFAFLDQLRVADLSDPDTQQAFNWAYKQYNYLYNTANAGTYRTWSIAGGSCCFKSYYDGTKDIAIGGKALQPSTTTGGPMCNGTYADLSYYFNVAGGAAVNPIPATFFDAGVSGVDLCADGDNPAFFAERYTGLPSCKAILDAGLSVGDGIYKVNPGGPFSPGAEVVCDMMGGAGTTIWEVGVGRVMDAVMLAGSGWKPIGQMQIGLPTVQLAILRTYGRDLSFKSLSTVPSLTNCSVVLNPVGTPTCLAAGAGVPALQPLVDPTPPYPCPTSLAVGTTLVFLNIIEPARRDALMTATAMTCPAGAQLMLFMRTTST